MRNGVKVWWVYTISVTAIYLAGVATLRVLWSTVNRDYAKLMVGYGLALVVLLWVIAIHETRKDRDRKQHRVPGIKH